MVDTSLWYALGSIGMALGTSYAVWGNRTDDRGHGRYYLVLALITGIATVAYAALALGLGRVPVDGAIFYVPRYVDWVLTTPLLVLYLAMLGRPSKRTYAMLVVLDVTVIASGTGAAFLPSPFGYLAYLFGVVAFLGILFLLLVVLPRQSALDAHRPDAVFTKLRNLTVVLWSIYPLVWLLGPFGLGYLLVETEAIVVTYLDLLAKVGFVVVAVNGRDALSDLSTRSSAEPAD
ncbi:MAG: bacteriorhodopsin [Halodesulfurarchaeum sp.]